MPAKTAMQLRLEAIEAAKVGQFDVATWTEPRDFNVNANYRRIKPGLLALLAVVVIPWWEVAIAACVVIVAVDAARTLAIFGSVRVDPTHRRIEYRRTSAIAGADPSDPPDAAWDFDEIYRIKTEPLAWGRIRIDVTRWRRIWISVPVEGADELAAGLAAMVAASDA